MLAWAWSPAYHLSLSSVHFPHVFQGVGHCHLCPRAPWGTHSPSGSEHCTDSSSIQPQGPQRRAQDLWQLPLQVLWPLQIQFYLTEGTCWCVQWGLSWLLQLWSEGDQHELSPGVPWWPRKEGKCLPLLSVSTATAPPFSLPVFPNLHPHKEPRSPSS